MPMFQNDCNWKELQVEYAALMDKKKRKKELSFYAANFFNTNLFSVCSEIIVTSVFLPTLLSRMLHVIKTSQNAVGKDLKRIYVNSL